MLDVRFRLPGALASIQQHRQMNEMGASRPVLRPSRRASLEAGPGPVRPALRVTRRGGETRLDVEASAGASLGVEAGVVRAGDGGSDGQAQAMTVAVPAPAVVNGVSFVGHNGGTPGYSGQIDIYPHSGNVVIILTNQDQVLLPAIQRSEALLTTR
jgi:hypothetical protein